MLSVLLFIVYLGAACFFINRIRLVKNSGLAVKTVIFLFLARIAAGCILGLVSHSLANGNNDYGFYNSLGLREYEMLFSDPHKFFTDIFVSNYSDTGEFFGSDHSYWNDLRTNIIFKIIGITDIFSRGNYYVNSLFFNFVAFLASVALYRVFIHIFPAKSTAVIIGCFLLPSTLYFSSGIHKDLIVFSAICFFCYVLYFSLEQRFSAKRVILLCLSFIFILLIRNFVAVLLLPPLLVWLISKRYGRPYLTTAAVTVICISGVICLGYLWPAHDPLQIIVNKQQAYLSFGKANTQFARIDTLQPALSSFAKAALPAFRHSFLSPLPGEFSSFYSNLFAAEMIIYWLLFFLMLFSRSRERPASPEFILFGCLFACLVLLFTGYISVAAGALVRYRSIYLPFLILPVLCSIDLKKLGIVNIKH